MTKNFNCGVFVCKIAECLFRRSPFDFTHIQMSAIRTQMLEQRVKEVILIPAPVQKIDRKREGLLVMEASKRIHLL